MASKTRYLQLTDTIMFEYKMLGEHEKSSVQDMTSMYSMKLKNGRTALVSPVSYECEEMQPENNEIRYKKKYDPRTLNTFNHLAVPKDAKDSLWFYFSDPDYKYVDSNLYDDNNRNIEDSPKIKEYMNYIVENDGEFFKKNDVFGIRWDSAKLYFVNGYDFSNMYGFMMRISVKDAEDKFVDFCNFIITRDNAYKLIKYVASPILMGNDIYDKYIEVNLPCLRDIIEASGENPDKRFPITISEVNPLIKMTFSVILSDDKRSETVEYTIDEINRGEDIIKDRTNVTFSRSSSITGSIPSENVVSDNLGCYISEVKDEPYLEFYATWMDEPLKKGIVWRFNKGIPLYNIDLIRRESGYEISDDYEVEHSERKWIAMHELVLSFCYGDKVIKTETYRMDQIFVSDSDPDRFYYRPLIFDEREGLYIDNIHIVYTMRFINADDKVQFVKMATMTLTGNMGRFFSKSTNLNFSKIAPYHIFTKIDENTGTAPVQVNTVQKTKYVNVFYNSTDVVLDDNGGNTYGTYQYTLKMSYVPKNYKFIFKKMNGSGKYEYMDLSNGYYRLMFIDSTGEMITVNPTFSTNMNLYLGELEFNINSDVINKLSSVEEGKRKMSIVSQGENGLVSSMFDLLYDI